jgi:UDP-2,3-diacylglucosamine pyrophosphatase LpxH
MPEVLVATPLNYSAVTQPYSFSDSISIRELSPILWDISIVKGFISERERDEIATAKYWLCASNEYEYVYGDVDDELYTKARNAAWALQIICPSGGKHIFLKFQKTEKGYDNTGSQRPKELCSTLLGRLTFLEHQGLQKDFDAVYVGVQRAFTEKVVRLQNPILLLEHGMQICNVNLGALMFVMGLDMLFMAGEIDTFLKRVGGFLGLDSLIFPSDSIMNRQPNTVVRDVLSDLYDFRNIIAHGQEIPVDPYRMKKDLISTDGERFNHDDYYCAELMLESSLFMLTTALRRVFVEGLFDDVRDPDNWRIKMRLYEHRYKEAGGSKGVKQRGR